MSCQGRLSTHPLCPAWDLAAHPHTHPRNRWEACRVWVLALMCHLNKSSALSASLVEWCVCFPLLPLQVTTNTVAQNNTIVLSCGSVGQKSHTGPTGLRARCPEALGENPFAGLSQLPEAPSFRGWWPFLHQSQQHDLCSSASLLTSSCLSASLCRFSAPCGSKGLP